MRGGSSPASAARMIATALSESACASAGSKGTISWWSAWLSLLSAVKSATPSSM